MSQNRLRPICFFDWHACQNLLVSIDIHVFENTHSYLSWMQTDTYPAKDPAKYLSFWLFSGTIKGNHGYPRTSAVLHAHKDTWGLWTAGFASTCTFKLERSGSYWTYRYLSNLNFIKTLPICIKPQTPIFSIVATAAGLGKNIRRFWVG